MARGPRRLRNLDLDVEDEEHVQEDDEESPDNDEHIIGNNLQGPPEVENILPGLPQQPASPIKIIWPNGEVRQILGEFGVSNLLALNGGRVIVGTDENGVPNERSASILGSYLGDIAMKPTLAPLHIPRWDNELFREPKMKIVRDVEGKFIYPAATKQLTRDWILWKVSCRWRTFKSMLKKKYFNPQDRSLDEIMKDVPEGVNEHQWSGLLGIWSKEKHKQLCAINSRCANQQKNPHTTGRKSHARLKKQMEEEKKAKVHKIELYDASHKKKDGTYVNNNVQTIMEKSHDELAKRKVMNNGNLSTQDFHELFDDVVAKNSKSRGYYDNKYWSQVKVSPSVAFIGQSEEEMTPSQIKGLISHLENLNSKVQRMEGFLAETFPGGDWRNVMAVGENNGEQAERVDDNNIQHGRDDDPNSDGSYEESSANGQPQPTNSLQIQASRVINHTKYAEGNTNSSLPCEITNAKQRQDVLMQNSSEANMGYAGIALPREHMAKMKQGAQNKGGLQHVRPISNQKKVVLVSQTNKGKAVALGNLVTTDSTHVIGGNMLGEECFGIAVHVVSDTGNERLPKPYGNLHTMRDAIGSCIAWPKTHVKRPKRSASTNA